MRSKLASPVTSPFGGPVATQMECCDHRVEVIQSFQPAVPAVAANPDATPPVAGSPGQAEVPYKETINSQVAFYAADGSQINAVRARLSDADYAKWDATVVDSDAYFLACHARARSMTLAS